MRINGYDVDEYLKGNIDDDNTPKEKTSFIKPSSDRRHVGNAKKVRNILSNINYNDKWNLYLELRDRMRDRAHLPMTFYRGYSKSAERIFTEVDRMSKSFSEMGLERGNQIVACMSNVPEVLVLLLAAAKCGLVVNFIDTNLDANYIRDVLSKTPKKKLFIGTDDKYLNVSRMVDEAGFLDKVIVSLADSLEEGIDQESVKAFAGNYSITNKVPMFKRQDKNIMSYGELLDISSKWVDYDNGFTKRDFYYPNGAIDLPLTITHTINSDTQKYVPIVHSNRAYVTNIRFGEPSLMGLKSIDGERCLAYLPTSSALNLQTCIINPIAHGCSVAFDPMGINKYFFSSMMINQPNILFATRSNLLDIMKMVEDDYDAASCIFANTYIVASIGEDISYNEAKYINSVLRNIEAGREAGPLASRQISLSVGAGTSEFGNLFFTPFKDMRGRFSLNKEIRNDYGLKPLQEVSLAVIDDGGMECGFEEYGRLVVKSACTMLGTLNGYCNNMFKIMDNYGRSWLDFKTYGAVLKNGNVLVKGRYESAIRLENGQRIPYFMIADKLMEQDGVMSCEVVKPKGHEDVLVAHIGFHPEEMEKGNERVLTLLGEVEERCKGSFSEDLAGKIVYRIRPYNNSYPINGDGVRSVPDLENEGIDNCYKPQIIDGEVVTMSASDYLCKDSDKAKMLVKE